MTQNLESLISVWFLMRIITLARHILAKKSPITDWSLALILDLYLKLNSYREHSLTALSTAKERTPLSNILDEITNRGIHLPMNYDEAINLINSFDRKAGILVTAHWLTYIFDYQEKAEYVWAHFPLFYSMALEMHETQDSNKIKRIFIRGIRLSDPYTTLTFKHRYFNKSKNLLIRTVEILCNYYEGSLTSYINSVLEYYTVHKANWIRFIAASLNALTYDEKLPKEEVKPDKIQDYAKKKGFITQDIAEIIKKAEFSKVQAPGTKRLWSALRDYILNPYFNLLLANKCNIIRKYIEEINRDIINGEKHLEQLELPGDVRNKDFFDNYVASISAPKGVMVKNPRICARRLYIWLSRQRGPSTIPYNRLYPIYLDVTWRLFWQDIFMKQSKEIAHTIVSELGQLNTEEEVIKAFNIIKSKLNIRPFS